MNEVVNGLAAQGPDVDNLPKLAVVPGGSTNVFARALGLPERRGGGDRRDPGRSLANRTERTVGLGLAVGTPGIGGRVRPRTLVHSVPDSGSDAGVVGRVEQKREGGKRSTHALYVRQVVRQFLNEAHRRHGTITLDVPGQDPVTDLALSIICNTAP